ncbi:hypothetical protein GALL_541850 [mine drainage metagenome]|uniref:Uncharacterized protein n=1 Tax=mine drainage metagenome TaxID=410659 RepID=A0A1J5NZQ9_9ZZZZ
MRVAMQIPIRIGRIRRPAQPGGAPNQRLIHTPPERRRPHEAFVVEPGGNQRRGQPRHRPEVETQRRKAVLAAGGQTVVQFYRRRPQIGRYPPRPAVDRDQCVRFLRPRRQDAARAVIFERPPHQMHIVGQQRGSQRIASVTFVRPSVETETNRPAAINPPARRGPERLGHWRHRPPEKRTPLMPPPRQVYGSRRCGR